MPGIWEISQTVVWIAIGIAIGWWLSAAMRRRDLEHAVLEARTDLLTGMPNRRAFDEALQDRLSDAAGPTTIALLDVDHFKQINDTHGHPMGDSVLNLSLIHI